MQHKAILVMTLVTHYWRCLREWLRRRKQPETSIGGTKHKEREIDSGVFGTSSCVAGQGGWEEEKY